MAIPLRGGTCWSNRVTMAACVARTTKMEKGMAMETMRRRTEVAC
jgi:hypothetical protein